MKKLNIIILLIVILTTPSFAQEHKIKLSQGTLLINDIPNLNIEGYEGKEIIITLINKIKIPESAKGLFAVNGDGLKDNTGLGIAVSQISEEIYNITEILEGGEYQLKIPENINLKIDVKGNRDSEIKIRNLKSNIEISSRTGNIDLKNVSSPLMIVSVTGKVNAVLNHPVKYPISIISLNGEIDVTLPEDIYADLIVSTSYGNLYTDMPITYAKTDQGEVALNPVYSRAQGGGDTNRAQKKEVVAYSDSNGTKITPVPSKKVGIQDRKVEQKATIFRPFINLSVIKGKLNGGGGSIILESRNNNVYVRSHQNLTEVSKKK